MHTFIRSYYTLYLKNVYFTSISRALCLDSRRPMGLSVLDPFDNVGPKRIVMEWGMHINLKHVVSYK